MKFQTETALLFLKSKKYEGLSWKRAILYLSFDMKVSMPSAVAYMRNLEKLGEINAEGKPTFLKETKEKNNEENKE